MLICPEGNMSAKKNDTKQKVRVTLRLPKSFRPRFSHLHWATASICEFTRGQHVQ